MTPREEQSTAPDIDRLARSMLLLHGVHDDDHPSRSSSEAAGGSWSKAPNFADDPARAEAVHDATRRDRDRYLSAGLQSVDCRFCHVTVQVKKQGPGHTAVQWNTDAQQRCAYFSEVRASGGSTARSRACPRLTDSISHAVAEGCLEAVSTAPAPGDG
jgi:hypothetical protein